MVLDMFVHLLLIGVLCIEMSLASDGENKLYYFERKFQMSHDKATEVCKRMGMNLARITTEQEFEYLKEYVHQEYGPLGKFWLDGYYKNGEWIWKGRGEKIEKFFWHESEPNNRNGRENCLHTWNYNFRWNDNECENKFYFICDIEA